MSRGRPIAKRFARIAPDSASVWVRGLLLGLILTTAGGPAAATSALEYRVKAAYLYNFLLFVSWPEAKAVAADSDTGTSLDPIRVCLFGADPFGAALDPIARRKVHERPILLQRLADGQDPSACHLLFVSPSERERWPGLVATLRRHHILSVSDMAGFASRGGIIGLVLKDGKVRLEINRAAAQAAGLRLSAKLLEIASTVYEDHR